MTREEIKHAEEAAEENEKKCTDGRLWDVNESRRKCAEEHRQFAEWLKDYKRLLAVDDYDEQMRDATKEEQESIDNYITSISTAMIPLSVIEDIKAEIKSLYAYYGDGSGWEESRNITLNEVMRIIDKHTSGKERA